MAGRASITIAVGGSYNASAMERAQKDIRRLQTYAAATAGGAAQTLTTMGSEIAKAGGTIYSAGRRMAAAGDTLTTRVTLPLAAIGGAAVATSIKFDDAMTDVAKTTNLPREEVERLKDQALELSRTTMVSAEQIMQAEALGGQLGIARKNLQDFAGVATGLDIATDMNTEQAATNLAVFSNLTKMAESDYERYGSTIVAVGNNMATTESQVSDMAQGIASAASAAGFSQADILGLAGALSSMGLEAQAGGSSVSRIINDISKSVSTGGERLEAWASVAGRSAEDFAAAWRADPAQALSEVIAGISDLRDEGGDVNLILEELGVTELRTSDAMRRLSGNTDVLTDGLALANKAWEENTALSDEVAAKNDSVSAKLQMLRNRAEGVAEKFGGPLVDALLSAMDAAEPLFESIEDIATAFKEADPATQRLVVQLVALAAAAGPVLSVAGRLTMGAGNVVTGFAKAAQGIGRFSAALTTTNPLVVESYQQNQTLASRLALSRNAMVRASGGAKAYREGLDGLYDMTRKAAVAQAQTTKEWKGARSENARNKIEARAAAEAQEDLTRNLRKTSDAAREQTTRFGEARRSAAEFASGLARLAGIAGGVLVAAEMAKGIYEMAIGLDAARQAAGGAATELGAFGEVVRSAQTQGVDLGLAFDGSGRSIQSLRETADQAFSNITAIIQESMSQWGTLTAEGAAAVDENLRAAMDASAGTTDAYVTQIEGIWERYSDKVGDTTGATLGEYVANVTSAYDEATGAVRDSLTKQLEAIRAKHEAAGTINSDAYRAEVQAAKDFAGEQTSLLDEANRTALSKSTELYGQVTEDQQRLWADMAGKVRDYKGSIEEFWSGGNWWDSSTVTSKVEADFDRLIDTATDGTTSAWVAAAVATRSAGGQLDAATQAALGDLLNSFEGLPPACREEGDAAMRSLGEAIEASGVELGDLSAMSAEEIVSAIRDRTGIMSSVGSDLMRATGDGLADGTSRFGEYGALAVQVYNDAIARGQSAESARQMAIEAAMAADQSGRFGESGELDAEALLDALEDYGADVRGAGSALAGKGAEGAAGQSGSWHATGGSLASTLVGGVDGGQASASGAGASLGSSANAGAAAQAGSFRATGGSYSTELGGGMRGMAGTVSGAAATVAGYARGPLEALRNQGHDWGSHLAGNVASGLRSGIGTVSSAASSVAQTIANVLRHSTPREGPLRDDDVWGAHIIDNLAGSMLSRLPVVERAVGRTADAIAELRDLSTVASVRVDASGVDADLRRVEAATRRVARLSRATRAEREGPSRATGAVATGGPTFNIYLSGGGRVTGQQVSPKGQSLLVALADELTRETGMVA